MMARIRTLVRWGLAAVVVLLVVAASFGYLLVRTQPGHDALLRLALRELAGSLNGTVTIGGVRAGSILQGFTLRDVRVRDDTDRSVLEADSIQVRYALRDLLQRDIVLIPARIWNMRLTIERLEEGQDLNVVRLLPSGGDEAGDSAAGTPGASISLALRNFEIRGGEVTVRLPLSDPDPDSRMAMERLPGRDGAYRVLRFTGIQALVAQADLVGHGGQRVFFENLSFTGRVLRTPFRVSRLSGEVLREGSSVALVADPIQIQGSAFTGRARVTWGARGGGVGLIADLESEMASLSDFRWIFPNLPDGEGHLVLGVSGAVASGEWRFRTDGFQVQESRFSGNGILRLGDPLRIVSGRLQLDPLQLSDVDRWLADPLGFGGSVRGQVSLAGDLENLDVAGSIAYDDGAPGRAPAGVEFDGGLDLASGVTFSDLVLTLDPFRYETLATLFPGAVFVGNGRVQATISGNPSAGLQFDAGLEHWEAGSPRSNLAVRGSVRNAGDSWEIALDTELDSLSLDGLAVGLGRDLPLAGMVAGTLEASGPLTNLALVGRLVSSAGTFDGAAILDLTDPFRAYRVEGAIEDFALHTIIPEVPDPTVLTGDIVIDAGGSTAETFAGSAVLNMRASRIAGLDLDQLRGSIEAVGGRLVVREFDLVSPVLLASGSGSLPFREGQPDGEIELLWSTPSIAGLRPVLFGEEPEALDLTQTEREVIGLNGLDGTDVDTLEPAALEGRAGGVLRLSGSSSDLALSGFIDADSIAYRGTLVTRGRADIEGGWARSDGWWGGGSVDVTRLVVDRLEFESAAGSVEYRPGSGSYAIDLRKDARDSYRLVGDLEHDSLGVRLALDSLTLDLGEVRWASARPVAAQITGSRVAMDTLRIVRIDGAAARPVRVDATGVIDLQGESDLRVRLTGVDLDQLAGILQTERLPQGILGLDVSIRGPARAPIMTAGIVVDEFSANGAGLTRVEGSLNYRERVVELALVGELLDETLLIAGGTIPIDLSLGDVPDRIPEGEMDVTLSVDALPAAAALAFVEALEEVRGSISGDVRLGGTLRSLRPTGEFEWQGGSLLLSELGIRPAGIRADLTMLGDSVDVLITGSSGGPVRIEGTVDFGVLSDPRFDLLVTARDFRPVDRRDIVLDVGANVTLTGTYTEPVVSGSIDVAQGELFLEEFVRASQVVDLTDPFVRDVVDTTFVNAGPAVVAGGNPFLRNLRVQVDLALPSDFWIRSRQMEVEMGGDLVVNYDRGNRELVLTGGLEAIRGTYTLYGKQFQVQDGTVVFAGTPGLDPALDIRATTRIRQQGGGGEQLNMTAQVLGTLTSPAVSLSSDAQPAISESDLISFLLFGRPTYQLTSGEEVELRNQLTSTLTGGAVTLGAGYVTSRIGTELGRQLGVDYFALTPAEEFGYTSAADLWTSLANAQIEIGQYWHPFFFAIVLPPRSSWAQGASPGARAELQLSDRWVVEGYVEDRWAQQGTGGFGALGARLSRVMGFALWREWGY